MKMIFSWCAAMAVMSWGAAAWAGEGKAKAGGELPPPPSMEDEDEPGGPMGRHRGGPGMEADPVEEREALDFIRETAPEMQDEFLRVRKERPAAFRKKLRHMFPMLKNPETREVLKRQFKLEFQVRRLTKEMRAAKADAKEPLKKDLAKALAEQFDAKLDLQVKRLQKMKDDISDLEGRISKRKAQKDDIVKKRLAELSGDSEPWDW
ncbi:MAG: hypothetical protein HZB91_14255 [Elusimicrobia bacterium]|nr:hypothetical protein [Elusimicrobiota bacterium]